MSKVVVLGIGNILLSDEGVGVKVVRDLEKNLGSLEDVEFIDGGTAGFSLLSFIESAKKLIIVDAISGGGKPGTIYKFKAQEVPLKTVEKISLHEVSLADVLKLAELRGSCPEEIVIIGIEPESLEMGLELSEPVKTNYKNLLKEVTKQLEEWGIKIR